MGKKQTSVSHSSTESAIIFLDAGFRLWMVFPLLICGIWSLQFLDTRIRVIKARGDLCSNQREVCSSPHTIHKRKQSQRVINELDNVDFIHSNVQSSHQEALLYVFEDNEPVIKMIMKGPTELLLIGCSIESIWTPKSKSNTLTPKTNSQTYWPREISHVMNGIIFCVCWTLAISILQSVLKWCRKERKQIQVKKEEVMEVRTGRPVNEQPPGLFAQHTDRFIVDDDDMDTNTVAESDLSLKSRLFLHRVNDRVRKMLDQFSKDATQDSNKHSLMWGMFMSSTLQASFFMGKGILRKFTVHQKYRKQSHNETDVWHIWKVDGRTIRWDLWSYSN